MQNADKLFAGVFVLAMIAVLVALNSTTSNAIAAFGNMLTSLIKAAMAPAVAAQKAAANTPLSGGKQLVENAVASGQSVLAQGTSLIGN